MILIKDLSSDGSKIGFSTTEEVDGHGGEYGNVNQLSLWIPSINPECPRPKMLLMPKTPKTRRLVVLYICFAATFTVFVTNLTLTFWAWISKGVDSDGVSTLFQGDCAIVRKLDAGLHALINALSTILLAASNFGLQLVTAPTRAEVDTAHSKGGWLDIGVPSFRNLRKLSKWNIAIWICLTISSVPIHFL
jgi:hypothetical protein